MILNNYKDPFEYTVISDFLSIEDSTTLFNLMSKRVNENESSYIDRTMFEDVGHIQTGIGIIGADFPEDISKKIQDNLIQVSDNFNYSQDLWSWVGGFNITNPDRYLGPHTDEYEYVKQTNPNAGILKVLLYIGNGEEDYTDWGTRLYNGVDKNENFVTEVPFVPGTALVFKATKDSYHGTNFPNGLDSYRIIYGAELTNA